MASELAKAYVQIIPSARGMKQGLSDIFGSEMPSAGDSAGSLFGANLVSKIKSIIAAAGIGKTLKQTISAGADLEQSLGGVETLFKDSANAVVANAEQAYKTAGMSANSYMETVTGFAASLLQGLSGDTQAAASIADMALTDMSDNANKMGTSMESIQNAYQGFAKQNYTMLDNLKLGYGGTKTEMERLLADAQELTGVEYDISNLADVYSAIHAIQEEMGITGTTALEAASTITGSMNSMKAAFTDVLGNLTLGRDLQPSLNALVETTGTFLIDNLVPAVTNIVTALPGACVTLITAMLPGNMQEIATTAVSNFSAFMTEGLPTILSNGEQMVGELVTGFTNSAPDFLATAGDLLGQFLGAVVEAWPEILETGKNIVLELVAGFLASAPDFYAAGEELLQEVGSAISTMMPELISAVGEVIDEIGNSLAEKIPGLSAIFENLETVVVAVTAAFVAYKAAMAIQAVISTVSTAISALQKATEGQTIAQVLLNAVMNANPFVLITTLIAGLVAAVIALWNTNEGFRNAVIGIWDGIKQTFTNAWDTIKGIWDEVQPYFSAVWEGIKSVFSVVGSILGGFFSVAWSAIKAVWDIASGYFAAIWDTIAGVFSVVSAVLSGNWSDAWSAIMGIVDTWESYFAGIWESIKGVFSDAVDAGSKVVEDIKAGMSIAWDGIVSWFTGIWDSLFGNLTANITVNRGGASGTRVDGSFASGLGYVPFDGFIAELHRGEMIVPAREADQLRNGSVAGGYGKSVTVNQYIYSEAKSAADLMKEARYQQELAVMMNV